ncbi:MAG: hypothetical protein WKF47_04860 [Geodermatophilaceae bacterium]
MDPSAVTIFDLGVGRQTGSGGDGLVGDQDGHGQQDRRGHSQQRAVGQREAPPQ